MRAGRALAIIAGLLAAGLVVLVTISYQRDLRQARERVASAAAQADAHACLLDALAIRRASIIGASAGAPSSMQFALRHPERTTHWCCWSRQPTCRGPAAHRR